MAVLLSALAIILVNKNPKLKGVFQIGYILIIIFLAVLMFIRIMQPISFKAERMAREDAAIVKLKDIRTLQEAFKDKNGKYTGNFDTLINFVISDSFELAAFNIVGEWDPDAITKEDAIKLGLIEKKIRKKSVRDSLFSPDYVVENIRYIPYTENEEFIMGAGKVETGSKVTVQVFEAYALYDVLFNEMERQGVINYKDQRYKITSFDGVKVGSLEEANNNAGNWEK